MKNIVQRIVSTFRPGHKPTPNLWSSEEVSLLEADAYSKGRSVGYSEGFDLGFAEGYNEGEKAGIAKAKAAALQALTKGESNGTKQKH